MSYNGYSNYETWCVNLWIDNDPYLYEEFSPQSGESIYEMSKRLKEFVEESMPEVKGMYADLLNAALSEVNWYEIAETKGTESEEEES